MRTTTTTTAFAAMLTLAGCYDGGASMTLPDGVSDEDQTDPAEGSSPGDATPPPPSFDPGPRPQLRRMTNQQFSNALADLLGDEPSFSAPLVPDAVIGLFAAVGGTQTVVSELGLERYETAITEVVEAFFADPERVTRWVDCDPAQPTCLEQTLSAFGSRAWRRELADDELQALLSISSEVSARNDDPWLGLQAAFRTVLMSPSFLYIVELGEPDPEDPGARRFTSEEMATRLAFFLWNGLPDEELLAAGKAGLLTDPEVILEQAARMSESPMLRRGMVRFFEEYLGTAGLGQVDKDPEIFGELSPTLGAAMKVEVRRMVEHTLFDQRRGVLDILDTQTTFVDPQLAELYGLDVSVEEGHTTKVELAADEARRGILGTAGFLASRSRRNRTSPTLRGAYIQERLRCVEIPPPPPGADNSLPVDVGDEPTSVREMLRQHREDPACAACHAVMDPIGLSLENFDGIGRWRTIEQGESIDASGELEGVPFEGLPELVAKLKADPTVTRCFVRQLHRFATGTMEAPEDAEQIDHLAESLADVEHRLHDYLPRYVASDAFRRLAQTDAE